MPIPVGVPTKSHLHYPHAFTWEIAVSCWLSGMLLRPHKQIIPKKLCDQISNSQLAEASLEHRLGEWVIRERRSS